MDKFDELEHHSEQQLSKLLKDKRNSYGYSVEEVAEKLLINKQDIIDLENGVMLSERNKSYSRLISRKYATFLKFEKNEVFLLIDDVYPSIINPDYTKKSNDYSTNFSMNLKKISNFRKKRLIIILCIVVFISGNIIFKGISMYETNNLLKQKEIAEQKKQDDIAKQKKQDDIAKQKKQDETLVSNDIKNGLNIITINSLKHSGNYKLKITAVNGTSYIDVRNDNTNQLIGEAGILSKGESYEYNIENIKKIKINLGVIKNIQISIDDKNLDEFKDMTEKTQGFIYIIDESEKNEE